MKNQIERIALLTNIVYSREPNWKVSAMILFPGASSDEIRALSERLPAPLPPSYREFLTITNGCLGFWARYALLGTTAETQEPIRTAIEDARSYLADYATGPDGSITSESIRAFETPDGDDQQLYVPNHVVFGANQGGEFFIFDDGGDPREREYEVIHYTYDAGVYERFSNFPAFLAARLEMLEKRVRERKYPLP